MASETVEFLLRASPQLLAVVILVALAGWLLWLDGRSRVHRAFAAILVLRAWFWLYLALANGPDDRLSTAVAQWGALQAPATIAAFTAFLVLYPAPAGWFGKSRWGVPLLWAVAAVSTAALAVRPELFIERGTLADGRVTTAAGPLFVLSGLGLLATAAVVLRLCEAAVREPAASRGPHILVAAGFGAAGMHVAGILAVEPGGLLDPDQRTVWDNITGAMFLVAGAAMSVGALRYLRRAGAHDRGARLLIATFALAAGTGAFFAVAQDTSAGWRTASGVAAGFWRLSLPLLVTYALVKHRLFDIDLKIKWTIRRGTVAAVFVAVFFIVASIAQEAFSESMGLLFGGVATGLLLFAIQPLQRMSERVADRMMPGVHDTAAYRGGRKLEVYRDAVAMAVSDGRIDDDDERTLAALADALGLGHLETQRVRAQVAAADARPGRRRR